MEQVEKTKFEYELIKKIDCFLDGHDNFTGNLLSFKIKSLRTNRFLNSKEICINQLVVKMIRSTYQSKTQLL